LSTKFEFGRVGKMDINYLGHSDFKIKTKNALVVCNSDKLTISRDQGVEKSITGPGEYEIMGVSVTGFAPARGKSPIYIIETDRLTIAYFNNLDAIPDDSLIDEIGGIDILIVPVGAKSVLNAKDATEVIGKIDPYFVIPMNFGGEFEPIDNFLKECGLPSENLPKFSIKKEDILEDQSAKVVVLESK